MSPPKSRAGQLLRNQMVRFGFGATAAAASSSSQDHHQAPLVRVHSVPSDEQREDDDDDDIDDGGASIITVNTNDAFPAIFSQLEMQQLGLQNSNSNTSIQAHAVWNGADDESTAVMTTSQMMILREEEEIDRVTQTWLEGGTQQQLQQPDQEQYQQHQPPEDAMKENGREVVMAMMVGRRSSWEGISPTGRGAANSNNTENASPLAAAKSPLARRSSAEFASAPLETQDPNSPPQQPNNSLELNVGPEAEDDVCNISTRLLHLVDSEESDHTASYAVEQQQQHQQHPLSTKSSGSSTTSSSSGLSELRRALQSGSSADDYDTSASKASSTGSDEFVDAPKIQMPALVSKNYKKKNANSNNNSTTDRALLTTKSSGSSSSALSEYPPYKDNGSGRSSTSKKRNSRGATHKSNSSKKPQPHPFLLSTSHKSTASSLAFSYSSTDSMSIPEPPPTVRSSSSSRTTKLLASWKEDESHAAIFRSPKRGPQQQEIVKGQPINESMKNVFAAAAAASSATTTTIPTPTSALESSNPTTTAKPSKPSSIGSSESWTDHELIVEAQSSTTEQGMEVVMDDDEPPFSSVETAAGATKESDNASTELRIETKGSGEAKESTKQDNFHRQADQSVVNKEPLNIDVKRKGVSSLKSRFESKFKMVHSPMADRAAQRIMAGKKQETKKEATVVESVPETKAPEQSQASPESKEDDDDGKDPYEWAYEVWRRKGLLGSNKHSTKKSSMGQASIATKETREAPSYRKGRQSLPALLVSTKLRARDQESFSSVMSKWKAKSEATVPPVPEASQFQPEKAPVMLFPVSTARQYAPKADDAVEKVNKPDSPPTKAVLSSATEGASSKFSFKLETHQRNAAASVPVEIKEPSPSPVKKIPQSQAWKLRWGDHVSAKERKRRESMPAAISTKRTFKTVPKSHGDYKKAVHAFLKNVNEPTATELSPHPTKPKDSKTVSTAQAVPSHPDSTRSQSTTRHRRKLSDDSSVFSPFLPPPASDTQPIWKKNLDSTRSQANLAGRRRQSSNDSSFFTPVVSMPTGSVAVANNKQKEESSERRQPESVPRNKSDDSNSSVSVIRSQLEKESKPMRQSLGADSTMTVVPDEYRGSIKNKPLPADCSPDVEEKAMCSPRNAFRVKDLTVEEETTSAAIKPPELALDEMISPDGRKVMKKLDKACPDNRREDVTPREEAFSDRPWRHDRLISRVNSLTENQPQSSSSAAACRCRCADSLFSGNDEMIEFFLPLTGTACTCGGNSQKGLKNPDDPTSLVNILRSWQVEFLESFGIYRGEDLVKANHRSASKLASALRQYRKKMGMTPFRTKSCITALQIWSKTSKAFVRSIRHQTEAHTASTDLRAPNNLYILSSFLDNVPADGTVPSTVAVSGSCSGSPFSFSEEIS